ncbi:MAG: hypothetical protein WCY09_04775 [Candidatus Omnitrophota bacterium]
MKKKFFVIFLFSVTLCFWANVHAAEKIKPLFDDRVWKLGWSQNEKGAVYEEYVLDGEVVENWSELVTIQFFPGLNKNVSLDTFISLQKKAMFAEYPLMKWESLYESEDERIWKWTIPGEKNQAGESEIARLKRTDEGFHIWHYAIKKSPLPPEKAKVWLEKLKAIEVSKI